MSGLEFHEAALLKYKMQMGALTHCLHIIDLTKHGGGMKAENYN